MPSAAAIKFLLLTTLLSLEAAVIFAQDKFLCGLPNSLQYAVQATGRTSGHLLTVTAYNPTGEPLAIPAVEVLVPGKEGTQTMICGVQAATIPAGGIRNISLHGESISFRRPALDLGKNPTPIAEWIAAAPENLRVQPGMTLPEGMEPVDTSKTALYLTYPHTDIPMGVIPALDQHLVAVAPVLFALNAHLSETYDRLWDAGHIQLPFARDQVYQIGLQQAKWYIFSILENAPYTKEELRQALIAQTEKDLGKPYSDLPATMQTYIKQSAEDIWAMIRMVALESGLE